MFDTLESPASSANAAALLDRIGQAGRAEAQAAAEKLVAIADLYVERTKTFEHHHDWAIDLWEAVAAEVAASLRIGVGLGASHLRYAMAMRLRLPKVGAVFEAGDIDYRLFQTIVYRTNLITDPDILALVDAQLAARTARWPSLTRRKLAGAIDKVVAKADPDAVRRAKECAEDRFVRIQDTEAGMAEIVARCFDTTAKAVDKRLDQLANSVCDGDPRTHDQRRADALDSLLNESERLDCRCENPSCPAPAGHSAPGPVVIHVVAEQATLDGRSDAPAVIAGSDALISAEVLREIATAARRLPIITPVDAAPEPRYAPSRALADYIRCRDLTCRAPGCDTPAISCDLDHTVPWAVGGKTHASNLKCVCRKHHLLKTFWGWKDEQLSDGTVVWTLPDGQRHVTTPGSALLFPSLCVPTGTLPARDEQPPDRHCTDRTAMMPKRSRTRAQNRAQAVDAERRTNRQLRIKRRETTLARLFPKIISPDGDEPPF